MRRTKADSDATARAVLAEATRAFTATPYAEVAVEDVARAAGVTRGAVYHHYDSKKGLFRSVVLAAQESVGEQVATAADAAPDPWAAFEAGCRAFLEASLADPVRRLLLVDAPAVLGWDVWREHDAATSRRHLEEGLTTLAEAGLVHLDSVSATTTLLSGAMNEAALSLADDPDELEEAWLALRQLLASLRIKPEGGRSTPR